MLRRSGELDQLTAGCETLNEFVETWLRDYAAAALSRRTLKGYASLWNRHGRPRLGHLQLRQVTPRVVASFRSQLEREGVGPASIYRTMAMLQGVFARAVEWERVRTNPFSAVKKPPRRSQRAVECLPPATVELLRSELQSRGEPVSMTLVSVLAYAGLRPEEALALEWRHVGDRTLLIEQKSVDGVILAGQKTSRPPRSVDLLAPLRQDLNEHRLASGRPARKALVFPRADGAAWREHDYRNWRRRVYQPAARAVGLERPRPYDLRHSFVSLLIAADKHSIVEIAAQLGHGPGMTLRTYAHVLAELSGQRHIAAADQIARARALHSRPLAV